MKGVFFVFYDIFCKLCNDNGLTPSGAASKIGFNRASVTVWKNTGKAPKQELLLKIADYFGVTTDYLLTGEKTEKPLINGDEELTDYLEELKNRSEMRMLFSVTKTATKEQIEAIVKMVEEMRGK